MTVYHAQAGSIPVLIAKLDLSPRLMAQILPANPQ